jgi:hypothetical protein
MDVLKVFNLIVCANNGHDVTAGWFFNLIFAPVAILFPFTRYSILALISITLFTLLIYTSDSPLMTLFNSDGKGNKSIITSLIAGFLIYMLQSTIILLFLRFNLCERTLDWESRDYHLAVQQYNNENVDYNSGYVD